MKKSPKKKSGKVRLTFLELQMRNTIICNMSRYGMTNNSIARVMNVTPSIVSRAIDDDDSE